MAGRTAPRKPRAKTDVKSAAVIAAVQTTGIIATMLTVQGSAGDFTTAFMVCDRPLTPGTYAADGFVFKSENGDLSQADAVTVLEASPTVVCFEVEKPGSPWVSITLSEAAAAAIQAGGAAVVPGIAYPVTYG